MPVGSDKLPRVVVGPSDDNFWLELGLSIEPGSPLLIPKIEDVDKYDFYFRDFFFPYSM